MTNRLYFGDNLDVLREHIQAEAVDLIYLDPPFNSKQAYNVLFQSPKGKRSEAQITAFEDSWHWSTQAEREYRDVLRGPNTDAAEALKALRRLLNESDMMAYLTMMTARLLELHRVLKPTGSLYLHCDPTASHFLKLMLDAVFGPKNFRAEIVWKRSSAHSDVKQGAKQPGRIHDTIFFYTKSDTWTWNPVYTPYSKRHEKTAYRHRDEDGRRFKASDLTAARPGGDTSYEWKGSTPPKNRYWAYSKENMAKFEEQGLLYYSRSGKPYLKQYLDEMPGVHIQDMWTDIPPLSAQSAERLGYPTQKPLALLERIIKASSNPGDVVLDPFCGCGTTIHAAHKLGRAWLGIDITSLAIRLVERRLKDAFPQADYSVEGLPTDLEGARDLAERDKHQFQLWACYLVDAQPYKGGRKGPDGGIDGLIFFKDFAEGKPVDREIIVSVKGGGKVGLAMLKELIATVEGRPDAAIGLFVSLSEPSPQMIKEAAKAGFYTFGDGREFPRIQLLSVQGLLEGTQKPQFIDLARGAETFKKAQHEKKRTQQDTFLKPNTTIVDEKINGND